MCHCCGCLGACGAHERCLGWWYRAGYGAIPPPVTVGKLRLYWIIWISLESRFSHTCDDAQEANSLLYRTGSNVLLFLVLLSILRATRAPCRSRAGPPSNLGVAFSADDLRIRATQGMPKRKNFNPRALSHTSTPSVLSTCPLHTNSGCGKERRILTGPWGSAKAAPVRNYLEVYWPCAGGL